MLLIDVPCNSIMFTKVYEKYKLRLCEAIYLPKMGNGNAKYFRNIRIITFFVEDCLNTLKKVQINLFQIY